MDLQEKSEQFEIPHLFLKENQDIEESYLKTASEFFKNVFEQRLHGIQL